MVPITKDHAAITLVLALLLQNIPVLEQCMFLWTHHKEIPKTAGGRKQETALRLPEVARPSHPLCTPSHPEPQPLLEIKEPALRHGVEPNLDRLKAWTAHPINSRRSAILWGNHCGAKVHSCIQLSRQSSTSNPAIIHPNQAELNLPK